MTHKKDHFVRFGTKIVSPERLVSDLNWGTLGAKSTTMSDDVPLRLPRYVFRRSNGSFRYKRNVPERLRPLIGKATLYRQLGDSYREAMQALPLVHAQNRSLAER